MGNFCCRDDDICCEKITTETYSAGIVHKTGRRISQEDAHCAYSDPLTDRIILGIFDGHGGKNCAISASKNLPYRLSSLKNITKETIENEFIAFDKEYLGTKNYDGSTAAVVILNPNSRNEFDAYVANIGDSVVLVIRDNSIIYCTTPHKPNSPDELNRVQLYGGKNVVIQDRIVNYEGAISVSRSFGDISFKRNNTDPHKQSVSCIPDIHGPMTLKDDDIIIIHCDGINETLNNNDVLRIVSENNNSYQRSSQSNSENMVCISEEIVNKSYEKGSMDNLSCLAVKINYINNRIPYNESRTHFYYRNHEFI